MKFVISAALVLAGLSQVLAIPAASASGNTTLLVRENLTCGTTSDAVASDCDTLLSSNLPLSYGKGHTCKYWQSGFMGVWLRKVYNPVCLGAPGNCCIYTENNDFSSDEVRRYGKELMKCRSVKKNLINGRIDTPKGALCISDGNGCGDCFED